MVEVEGVSKHLVFHVSFLGKENPLGKLIRRTSSKLMGTRSSACYMSGIPVNMLIT
jgi:hypothetical protein